MTREDLTGEDLLLKSWSQAEENTVMAFAALRNVECELSEVYREINILRARLDRANENLRMALVFIAVLGIGLVLSFAPRVWAWISS